MIKKVIFWGLIFKFSILLNQELTNEQWPYLAEAICKYDSPEDQCVALFPELQDIDELSSIRVLASHEEKNVKMSLTIK